MTNAENLPAVPDRRPPADVASLDVDGWVQVARPIFELAARVYDTDFVPRGLRGSEPATAAAMLYGRELNLPPMTSLASIHVIEGKPGLSAEQMRAMVFAAGHEIEFTESTGALCTARGRRRGQERWTAVTWTIDMARAAGLANKNVWKSYPRTQLQARCTTELARLIFPDVIHGFRSVEELEDMGEADGTESGPGAGASGTSKVSRRTRKRAATGNDTGSGETGTAKGSQPAPVQPPELSGPPLPGEPGYEDTPGGPPSPRGAEDAGEGVQESGTRDPETGEDTPSPAPTSGGEVSPGETETPTRSGGPVDAATPHPPTPEDDFVAAARRVNRQGRDKAAETAQHDDDVPTHPVGPRKASRAQMRMLWGTLGGFGITGDDEREERLLVATTILGREVETFGTPDEPAMSAEEVKTLLDALALVTPPNDRAALNRLLDQYDADKLAIAQQEEGQ